MCLCLLTVCVDVWMMERGWMLWSHTYSVCHHYSLLLSIMPILGGGQLSSPYLPIPLFATRPLSLHPSSYISYLSSFPIPSHVSPVFHVYLCHKLVPICIRDTQNVSIPPRIRNLSLLYPASLCITFHFVFLFTLYPSSLSLSLFTQYPLSLCIPLCTLSLFSA